MDASCSRPRQWTSLAWWTLFAAAFGLTEAMTVVYIRRLLGMPPGMDYREWLAVRHFPLTSAHYAADFARSGLMSLEVSREAATLLLLLGAACAAGRTGRERLALFLYTFAVWDLAYYLWLKVLLGFPQSLLSTDVYFLIPIAWYGPVWFPVLVVMPLLAVLSLRLLSDGPAPAEG